MAAPFLTARWESLVFLNYPCPPALLEPLVPRGTVLDTWNGQALCSVVGFLFDETLVRGIPVPFHRRFPEVNLRFYVRRELPDGTHRRAVVFVRELVPRLAIAGVARGLYNEPYLAVPMSWRRDLDPQTGGSVEYAWRYRGQPYTLSATVTGAPLFLQPGSEEEFITEHYWGYTRQRNGGTLEYQVEHPSWRVWSAAASRFEGPAGVLYGAGFDDILSRPPQSAFVAVGSAVTVRGGLRLPNA